MGFEQLGRSDAAVANARGHLPRGKAQQFRHGGMVAKALPGCLCEVPHKDTEWTRKMVPKSGLLLITT